MRGNDPFVTSNERHDRHRFGRIHCKVPSWMMLDLAFTTAATQLLLIDLPIEQSLEGRGIDLTVQSKLRSDGATPLRMFVGTFGVIITHHIIAGEIGRCALQATRMDHAGVALLRAPS